MWVINTAVLLLFLLGFLYFLKRKEDWMQDIDKKEHILYFLYPLAYWILIKSGLDKFLSRKKNISDSIKALYITNKPELINKLFWCRRIAQIIAVLVLVNLLTLIGYLSNQSNSILVDGKYLTRPAYGEGSNEVELNLTLNPEETATEGNTLPKSQKVTINVKERLYTEEEIEQLFAKAIEYLEGNVLGENESAELIYTDLNFCNTIPGTSITVDWYPEDYNLIRSDGVICNDRINAEGITTSVIAVLNYYGVKKEHTLSFQLMPRQYSEAELFKEDLKEEVNKYSENTAADKFFELPLSLEKYNLIWESKEDRSELPLFLFGLILAALLWFYGDKEIENQMKKRKEQMLMDYPEIVNKFTLLINAGMTIKQAWSKIAEDYNLKLSQKGVKKHYAYEEMLTTVRELKLGTPENIAYEQYGRRTGLIPYIKFSSLITQNLKKGTKGFTELLMKEALEAFEDRKVIAKRLGEEAGTKLLMPMMILLILVFLIIMIPAFSSFQI